MFKIDRQHWLEGVKREEIKGGSAMKVRRFLVTHFTAGASAKSSINFWRSPEAKGASAHVIIDRDGTPYQCRPFNKTCGHAGPPGKSRWIDPKTGQKYNGCNPHSIGIELANAGDSVDVAKRNSKLPLLRAKHRNGGAEVEWEQFTDAQLKTHFEITKALVQHYNLDDVTGHDCIAPERKNDPGPVFPMQQLREYCGFKGMPSVHRK